MKGIDQEYNLPFLKNLSGNNIKNMVSHSINQISLIINGKLQEQKTKKNVMFKISSQVLSPFM
jgi:hypothetical protein